MTRSRRNLLRTALFAAALLLPALVATPPASADWEPVPAVDCFGNPLFFGLALFVPPGGADFYGTAGDDVIIGTDGHDDIFGEGGRDVICGGDGDDYLWGGEGNDHIDGQAGGDVIHGDDGNDHLYGGANAASGRDDIIFGGDDVDEVYGEGGPDTLECGDAYAGWDVGDFADGGTGMPAGQAESDWLIGSCSTSVNFP